MVNSNNGRTEFIHRLIELSDDLGEDALALKSSIDQTVLGSDTCSFLENLAKLDKNVTELKTMIANAGGVGLTEVEVLLMIENCKDKCIA